MSEIIIYKGAYQYDVVNIFAEQLGAGFSILGKDVSFIDLRDSVSLSEKIKSTFTDSTQLVIGFGGAGCDIKAGAESLYKLLNIPFVSLLVDHPVHHMERFSVGNSFLTCYAAPHVDFIKKYFCGGMECFFLPHGGCKASDRESVDTDKSIDILYAASFIDPDVVVMNIRSMDDSLARITLDTVDVALATDSMPIEDAMTMPALSAGIDPENSAVFKMLARSVIPKAELMLRAVKRLKTLEVLDRASITVTLFGNNWPKKNPFTNHILNSPRTFPQILSMMKHAKITLNTIMVPGSHERVFSAMLNGSAVLSDWNRYYDQTLTDGKNSLLYRWTDLDELPDKATRLLEDNQYRCTIASEGQEFAEKAHTWTHRAHQLLEFLEAKSSSSQVGQ